MYEREPFKAVPEDPPVPPGHFMRNADWGDGPMQRFYNRIDSASSKGALTSAPLGSRGGTWYAITSERAWRAWATDFNRRGRARLEAAKALDVKQALTGVRRAKK